MPDIVSPLLYENIEHTQVSATVLEFETVLFSLAHDEAVELVSLDVWTQITFPISTAEAMMQFVFSIDPNEEDATITSGIANNTGVNTDTIWNPRGTNEIVVEGGGQWRDATAHRDLPPGLIIANSMRVGFNTNNVGAQTGARVWYHVVRLGDRELVSLVARRRAR